MNPSAPTGESSSYVGRGTRCMSLQHNMWSPQTQRVTYECSLTHPVPVPMQSDTLAHPALQPIRALQLQVPQFCSFGFTIFVSSLNYWQFELQPKLQGAQLQAYEHMVKRSRLRAGSLGVRRRPESHLSSPNDKGRRRYLGQASHGMDHEHCFHSQPYVPSVGCTYGPVRPLIASTLSE